MRALLAILPLIAAAPAAAEGLRCPIRAEVLISYAQDGTVEIRHDVELGATITLVEQADALLLAETGTERHCPRVGETRFRCATPQETTEIALLGDRVRLLSTTFGGVRGDVQVAVFSGTCEKRD